MSEKFKRIALETGKYIAGATMGIATVVNTPIAAELVGLQRKVAEPVKTEERSPKILDGFIDLADDLISIEKNDDVSSKSSGVFAIVKTKKPVPLNIREVRTVFNDGDLRAFIPLQPDKNGNVSNLMFLKEGTSQPVLFRSALIGEKVYSAAFKEIPKSNEAIFTIDDNPQEIAVVNDIIKTDGVRVIQIYRGGGKITLQMLPNTPTLPDNTKKPPRI
jgi:hypothetical protein